MSEEGRRASLMKRDVEDLRIRAGLLQRIIEEAKAKGDERWKDRVADLELLEDVIREKKPPPTVIGMKPAEVNARAKGGGHGRG